jgi:hypothetical protein
MFKFFKHDNNIAYCLALFFVSRLVLTLIGTASRVLLDKLTNYNPSWIYSKHLWLDVWGIWDTGWYLMIAKHGYSASLSPDINTLNQATYAFFPLFPILIRIIPLDIYISAILISNISLLLTSFFLYKLVLLEYSKDVANKAVFWLFCFPSSFLLSAALSESLFLFLVVLCFYLAKRESPNWVATGVVGFFLALTRPNGFLVMVPLVYEYLKSIDFMLKVMKKSALALMLIPLGTVAFCLYCYYLTGDWLAWVKIRASGWGHHLDNPFNLIWRALFSGDFSKAFNASYFIGIVITMLMFRRLSLGYVIYSFLSLASVISIGMPSMHSIVRYSSVLFPIFIFFSVSIKGEYARSYATVIMLLLQGFLMVFWASGFNIVV